MLDHDDPVRARLLWGGFGRTVCAGGASVLAGGAMLGSIADVRLVLFTRARQLRSARLRPDGNEQPAVWKLLGNRWIRQQLFKASL